MKLVLLQYSFLCYALIALGQLWLYSLNLRSQGIYDRVAVHTNEWIGSHSILFLGAILIFPATLVLKGYLNHKRKYLVYVATALTLLGAIALISQYILDFYLITLFTDQTATSALTTLDQIQSNRFIKFICYDLIAAWLFGQLLFISALIGTKNYPKWALGFFVLGVVLTIFGDSVHELLERISYLLISISLWPIFKERYF